MARVNKSKRIQFFLNTNISKEASLFIWIDQESKGNYSSYIKEILTKVKEGKLTVSIDDNLKNKKLVVEIELKKTQIELNKLKIIYYNTFQTDPSNIANRAMKTNVTNQIDNRVSCYNEKLNRLECPECGILVVIINKDLGTAKNEFADHYSKKHGIIPSEIFEELTELR